MAGFSNYTESAVLGHVFGSTVMPKPAGVYVALLTSAPTDAGGGTEVSTVGTGYQRKLCAFTVSGASPTVALSQTIIEWQAAAPFGTITHAAVYDAVVGGNQLGWMTLESPKTISTSDIFRLNANGITVRLD